MINGIDYYLSGFLKLPSSRPIDLQFELMVFDDVWVIVPSHKCEVKFWVIYSVNIILSIGIYCYVGGDT